MTAQAPATDTQLADPWLAPYHAYSGDSEPSHYGGTYTVYFFPDHTLAAHNEFLGFKVQGTHRRNSYEAILKPEKLEQVRIDPGVKNSPQESPFHWHRAATKDGNEAALAMLKSDQEEAATSEYSIPANIAMREAAAKIHTAGQEWVAPYYPYDGSKGPCNRYDRYVVDFFEGHTMKKHTEVVGPDVGYPMEGLWYQWLLSEEQMERVRRDPGVSRVQQCGPAYWG